MLPEVFAARISRRDFLNVSTGQRIRVDLPGLRYQFVIGPTSEGLILPCRKRTGQVRLLNPLTKQLMTLPDATSLLSRSRWKPSTGLKKLKELRGFSAGLADSSTVALHFDDHALQLAVIKPNAEQWSHRAQLYGILAPLHWVTEAVSFGNRFCCFTGTDIKVMDVPDAGQQPQLVAFEVGEDFQSQGREHVSLVDNHSKLILLRRKSWRSITEPYNVHRSIWTQARWCACTACASARRVPLRRWRGLWPLVVGAHRAVFVHHGRRNLQV
jgi:hypothetical protein